MNLRSGLALGAAALTLALACGGDDDGMVPDGSTGYPDSGPRPDSGPTPDGGPAPDAPIADGGTVLCAPPTYPPDPGSCTALDTDYSPGADDMWPACISDDGTFHPIMDTISTVARVTAFEDVAELLFDPTTDASSEDFVMARMIIQVDEGIDSRLARRYDPHYTVPDGTDCTVAGTPAMHPEYCVGPALLQPTVLDALNDGIAGTTPRVSAARVEAALLWFFYVSTYKESSTCTTTPQDCDSAWAYYTGGVEARCGIGLSRYVWEVDAYAHDRAWDGALAVRCWRDLDPAPVATDLATRERARDQYDSAALDGVAAIVKDRFMRFDAATGLEQEYYLAFLTTLGPVLDREMTERSPADAMALREELARTDPAMVDVARAVDAIDAVFTCP